MYSKTILIGRIGQDPKSATLPSGKSVVNFSIATSEYHKDKDTNQRVEKTEWHNCVAFDKTADVISLYTRKGSLVFVEGQIRTREYEDKNNGQKRKAFEVLVREVKLLDPKPVEGRATAQSEQAPADPVNTDDWESDIPFDRVDA